MIKMVPQNFTQKTEQYFRHMERYEINPLVRRVIAGEK
jgi:hypothetical protein